MNRFGQGEDKEQMNGGMNATIHIHKKHKEESEGFEGTDIACGNPTSKTLMPAGGVRDIAESTINRVIYRN